MAEIGEDWSRITMKNGEVIEGRMQHSEDQANSARELGYGDNTGAMVRLHDPLHVMICDRLGLEASFSMLYACGWLTPEEQKDRIAHSEEAAVYNMQTLHPASGDAS